MQPVTILCEGPTCNGGRSADEQEASLIKSIRAGDAGTRAEAEREIRAHVTRSLVYTPHVRCGGWGGGEMYACTVCYYERAYGARKQWERSPYA